MKQNNFGVLSGEYSKARRGYPPQLFDYLNSLIKASENGIGVRTLDTGCGTGISTRQLKAAGFRVIGCDAEEKMIQAAEKENDGITYVTAPAHSLPFESDHFDMVTTFTSFHWFSDPESIEEIKRILKPGGMFFVASKNADEGMSSEDFRNEYQKILKKYVGDRFDMTKDFFPSEILNKNSFNRVSENSFFMKEEYMIDEALVLLRSFSFWNLIGDIDKPLILEEITALYKKHLVNGFVVREWEVKTVVGYK